MGHINKADEGHITGEEPKKTLPSFFYGVAFILVNQLWVRPKFTVFAKRLMPFRTPQKIVCICTCIYIYIYIYVYMYVHIAMNCGYACICVIGHIRIFEGV